MRTFIIRARKGSTRWDKLRTSIGSDAHIEVVAHSVINAFFVSNNFRPDVEVYIIFDSSEDFPRTIKLSSSEGLSLAGFHESAVLDVLEQALKVGQTMQKDEIRPVAPGVEICGFGFERLVGNLLETRSVYQLEPKGESIGSIEVDSNPVFVLSDHLALPKKIVTSFQRRGMKTISLGKRMLFAAQCVTIIQYEMDNKS